MINRFFSKRPFLASLLLIAMSVPGAHAQSYILKGSIFDEKESFPIPNTYIINNRSYAGTVSNGIGYFETEVKKGDTLVISNIGYQFYYLAIDSTILQYIDAEQRIALVPRNYLLDEVSIYAITSNNPKTMPMNEPRVPRNADIRTPETVAPTLANPLDLLYYSFGKRPKQLAALRQLQQEDTYRRKLEEGSNREMLEELTGIPKAEMEAFMFYCKYSEAEIRLFNDYQFLVSLLECYELYQRDKERDEVQTELKKNTR
jgi:hypothetical protein